MPSSAETDRGRYAGAADRPVARVPREPSLDDLLEGGSGDLGERPGSGDRMRSLLDVVLRVSGELDADSVRCRVVRAAVDLVDAREAVLEAAPGKPFPERVAAGSAPRPRLPGTVRPEDDARPESAPRTGRERTTVRIPVRVHGEVAGVLRVSTRSGPERFGADDADDEFLLSTLAVAAGTALENAEHYERSRLRCHRLEVSAPINSALLAGASAEDSLRRIAEAARDLVGARTVAVLGADSVDDAGGATGTAGTKDVTGVGGTVSVVAHSGSGGDRLRTGERFRPGPVLAEAVETARPRVFDGGCEVLAARPESGRHRDLSGPGAVSPLGSPAGTRGVLLAIRGEGDAPFTANQLDLLASFAAQATRVWEFADIRDGEREAALLGDRDRIASDLHDHVIQRLFATGMALRTLVREVDDPGARDRIGDAVQRLDTAVRRIRTTINDLHSPAGAGGGESGRPAPGYDPRREHG